MKPPTILGEEVIQNLEEDLVKEDNPKRGTSASIAVVEDIGKKLIRLK